MAISVCTKSGKQLLVLPVAIVYCELMAKAGQQDENYARLVDLNLFTGRFIKNIGGQNDKTKPEYPSFMLIKSSKYFRAALLSSILMTACGLTHAQAGSEKLTDTKSDTLTDWAAVSAKDISYAVELIRKKHIGSVSGHLNVTEPLLRGEAVALAEAAKAKSQQDYLRLMSRFFSSFGDPHTAIDLDLKRTGWTGLIIDQVDGQFRVVWSEKNWPTALPAHGAIVQSCDGVWIGTYLQNKVMPYLSHAPEYPTSMSESARGMMMEGGLGLVPSHCVFSTPDGSPKDYQLSVLTFATDGNTSASHLLEAERSIIPVARKVAVYTMEPDMHWVGMPSFGVSDGGKAYEQVYAELEKLKQDKWIVFDLRGNGGGSSSWGNRALVPLFGKSYSEQLAELGGLAKYMVATQDTLDFLRKYAADPNFAAAKAALEALVPKIELAMAQGHKLALVGGNDDSDPYSAKAGLKQKPAGPRIAAVIDRHCFSSCMNFLQQLKAIPDTVVLGEPTIGYSPYGEIAAYALPSGKGQVYIPGAYYKVAEATREMFVPDIPFTGNLADDARLMQWVGITLKAM